MVVDTIASIPPLQHGDFHALGLCHWTPPGLVQYSFELVNILTGLPWFHTFIAATLFWRLVLVPFAIIGTRHSSRMRPQTGKLNEASAAMQAARAAGDTVAMQRASLQAAKIRSDADVSMAGLMAPMVQLPISLGMFIGIKRMCELPVMQLTQSGVEWLPDLTQPGPYYILPILVAVSGNMMISMSRREMDPSRPSMGHIMNGFRVLTLITIPWMNFFPSGLLLSLLVTSVTGVVQTAALRIPAIRTALSIPEWTPPPPGTLPTMKDTFNEYINPFTKNKRQQQSPLSSQMIVKPYIPLKTPEPLKTVAPSTTAAAATSAAAPPSLEVMAQQAQAHPSVKASSLFEKDSPAPAPKSPKPSKGAKKVKAKRA
ncbi:60Kd inner membrane protein-domain-containing protein [Mycena vulgaris]|nr:60Kd inner membrane protein-domain-containing protein [Mycena vulgaris]